jgi:hypothetical protein
MTPAPLWVRITCRSAGYVAHLRFQCMSCRSGLPHERSSRCRSTHVVPGSQRDAADLFDRIIAGVASCGQILSPTRWSGASGAGRLGAPQRGD